VYVTLLLFLVAVSSWVLMESWTFLEGQLLGGWSGGRLLGGVVLNEHGG
jgi:hypothetical protein